MDCRISETFWHASATDGSMLEGLNTILEMSVDNRVGITGVEKKAVRESAEPVCYGIRPISHRPLRGEG